MHTAIDAAPAAGTTSRRRTGIELLVVFVLFLLLGAWYAGPAFLAHMNDGIASQPVDGAVVHMSPGDPYDAYYRHLLPYYNLQRDHAPFWTGYQYNLGQPEAFREGMMYVPFAALASAMAFVTGPVLAFNLLALLSFSLCGIFAYLMGREISGSRIGGLLAAAVVALAPFRAGFLFCQMFYGTDMALLPLSIYAYVRFMKVPEWRTAALAGTSIMLLAMANIALFYWFAVFFGPLFAVGAACVAMQLRGQPARLAQIGVAAGIPLAIAAWFLWYVKGVMAASGLGHGQDISEVRSFSPGFDDLLAHWSGIETTVYLGVAGIVAVLGAITLLHKRPRNPIDRMFAVYCVAVFFGALALSMGTTFDDATGVPLYEFVFEHLPFANGSRTPGRIIPIAIVAAAVLVALAYAWLGTRMRSIGLRVLIGLALVAWIAVDFKFTNATMATLAGPNRAYEAIDPARGTAIGLPLQQEAEHYLHATYQYYAIVNDVRMVNGHSSMFPPGWDALMLRVRKLNEGVATRDVIDELQRRGVRYIVAHGTAFEPHVTPMAIAVLARNPALRKVAEDDGVVTFEIVAPERAPTAITPEDFTAAVLATSGHVQADGTTQAGGVQALTGWYSREAYPGQPAFRWMEGTTALLMVEPKPGRDNIELRFDFRCPMGGLEIAGPGVAVDVVPSKIEGWSSARVRVTGAQSPQVLSLRTPQEFTAPGDPRKFGCMVGDIAAE